jgi:hypothetical protein
VVEIATDGKPLQARQMASSYLKNTLYGTTSKTQVELDARWKSRSADIRNVVKDGLLAAMRCAAPN